MQRTAIFSLLLITAVTLFQRCANPVSPQGGPRDEKPPEMVSCDPPNFNTGFKSGDIRINFNEFINLKNPATEVFVSPPQSKAPDIRTRGKSVLISLDDSLLPQTTYTITFGNAITDLTEGNILRGFSYVMSTGSFLDSLSLQGTILSAFDRKPQKDVLVGFYLPVDTVPVDSMPFVMPPYYVTRSDENGKFILGNLQNRPGRLFAVSDQNGDMFFSQPNEKIAFLDSTISPFYRTPVIPDSLKTALPDSSVEQKEHHHSPEPVHSLFLFEETDSVQRIVKASLLSPEKALLIFRHPVSDLRITPVNFDSVAPWNLIEYSEKMDSVTLWITLPETDSLQLKIVSEKQTADTIDLAVPGILPEKKRAVDMSEKLTILHPAKGFSLNQYTGHLILSFSSPLTKHDFSRILLVAGQDTVHPRLKFADSLHRKILCEHKWEEEKPYKLIIPDSSLTGLNSISHDTLFFPFRTRAEKDFGNLTLNLGLPQITGQYIVQLLNESESVKSGEIITQGSGKISFRYKNPGKYKIKAIVDQNNNGRWDTGSYKLKLQPETVLYLPKTIEIRANWDVEESWF